MQETRPPLEQAPAVSVPPIQVPAQPHPAAPSGGGDVRVLVAKFIFSGNSVFSDDQLQAIVAGWKGRQLNFGELIQAVEAIEASYRSAGYFLAQAYLPPQKIKDGSVEIAVSEGRLGETRLEGESLVSSDVLFSYLDRLPKDQALTLPLLERQILLINELSGSRANLDLQAGDQPGTTDVVLALKPDEMLSGRVELNNYGLPSTGEKRLGVTLDANSALGLGERISFGALTSENRNLTSYNLRGELPAGSDGWRILAGASRAEYTLGGSFAALDASGFADSLRLGVAYPFIRSRAANLKLQVEADDNKLVDRFRAYGFDLDKRSRGLTATLSGDLLDELMGGGATRADLALRSGHLVLGPVAKAFDSAGTAGSFDKATITVQRQQTLGGAWSLQLQYLQQLASKNLDSSEKLTLGGPTTLPGYANGESSGDEGLLAKLAVRWQVMPELGFSAFTDYGSLRIARNPSAAATVNRRRLTDAGISADWSIGKGFSASAILAWAGKESPNPADNDRPRFWFNLGYAW
jgi:hemolysin activation/secretion protein